MKSVIYSQINEYGKIFKPGFLILANLFLSLSIYLSGQGSGCINGPTVNLTSTSGSTCGLSPVTISGSFGGSATNVTVTENGEGSVSPRLINSSPFTFTYTPRNKDNHKNVTITVTTNNPVGSPCTVARATLTLAIGSGLSAPVIGTVTNASCLNQTGSVMLSGLPSGGTWVITGNPGGLITRGTGTSTTISDLAAGTYTFTVTNSLGCTSSRSANVVISSQIGVVNLVITNPPAVCAPLTVDLTSPAITSGSSQGLIFTYWTNAEATIAYSSPSAAGAGTYYIKGTMRSDCYAIKPVVVTVSSLTAANAGTGGHICGSDFKLNAILSVGMGTWAKISGPGHAIFTPDNNQPDANVNVDQAGIYDFAWNVNNSSCASSDIVRVIFHELPSIDPGKSLDTIICKGASIQLHAAGNGFFDWTPSELFNNPNISDPVVTPVTSTTISVKLTDQFGCENSAEIKIGVQNKPVANAGPDQILASSTDTEMDAVLYDNNDKGVWSLISGSGEFFDSTYPKTSLSGLSQNKNEFKWTVTNDYCPASTDTVLIIVSGLDIPTLITPNMDGKNDYLIIRGFKGEGRMELVIFDRRGVEVYKNANYDNEWNGIDYNKKPLQDDTYFYVLKTKSNLSIKGFIVVRR